MDRSIGRFLCLPVFDGEFREALARLQLDHVEFWLALADGDQGADDHLSGLLPALTEDDAVRGSILNRLELVNILAAMVKASAARISREIAADLGYGAADLAGPGAKRQRGGETALHGEIAPEVGRQPRGHGPTAAVASLQSAEEAERRRWGLRLQAICTRAGPAAGINDPRRCVGLAPAEVERLRRMVFEAGGHRTIRQHVRCWEKFEDWAVGQGHSVYPPTAPVITRYALHLQDQGCGPAVIPAMRYGVSWVCKRLAMAVPEGADQQIQAISEQVYQARGRELKEASPVPPKLVMALEIMVETCAKVRKPALALLSWWALILIYASLRFDDGVHVAPLSLQITEDALYGVVWQTKVERKRRGTRFAAPRCSLSGIDWLKIGWELFAPFRTDRDFFIWDLKTDVEFTEAPVTYTRGLAWLKHILMKGVSQLAVAGKAGVNEAAELKAAVRPVTWHSMRVTFLSEAVKASVDDKVVGLQANWKDPKQLVLKYARQRKELSVAMVKKVAAQLRDRWTPDPAEFLVEEEDAEVGDVHPVEYIVRKSLPKTAADDSAFRCHVLDPKVSTEVSICGRLKMEQAMSVGAIAPGIVCAFCKARAG